jgi:hypothetical protein
MTAQPGSLREGSTSGELTYVLEPGDSLTFHGETPPRSRETG